MKIQFFISLFIVNFIAINTFAIDVDEEKNLKECKIESFYDLSSSALTNGEPGTSRRDEIERFCMEKISHVDFTTPSMQSCFDPIIRDDIWIVGFGGAKDLLTTQYLTRAKLCAKHAGDMDFLHPNMVQCREYFRPKSGPIGKVGHTRSIEECLPLVEYVNFNSQKFELCHQEKLREGIDHVESSRQCSKELKTEVASVDVGRREYIVHPGGSVRLDPKDIPTSVSH